MYLADITARTLDSHSFPTEVYRWAILVHCRVFMFLLSLESVCSEDVLASWPSTCFDHSGQTRFLHYVEKK